MPRVGPLGFFNPPPCLNEIGFAVVRHLQLTPAQVDRVYTKQNGQGLLIAVNAGERRVRSILLDADYRPDAQALEPQAVLASLLERQDLPPELRSEIQALLHLGPTDGDTVPIRSFEQIPLLSRCNVQPVEYLEEPILPARALVGITGESGCGKSSLSSALAGRVAARGVPALILDRDNPLGVVSDRFRRLGVADGPSLRIWGGCALRSHVSLIRPCSYRG